MSIVFIIYSYGMKTKNIDKVDALQLFKDRFSCMDRERSKFMADREICDIQYKSVTQENPNTGAINVNIPIEANTTEFEVGRTAWMPLYSIDPDPYDPNPEETETAKYLLEAFLDKEKFHVERRKFRTERPIYGTWILYTWLRYDIEKRCSKKTWDIESNELWNGIYTKWLWLTKEIHEKRMLTPKNIPIRSFWVDDRVIDQSDFSKAVDCVYSEVLSKEEYEAKYKTDKDIKKPFIQEGVDMVSPTIITNEEYWSQSSQNSVYIIYHYYNRIAGRYIVVAKWDILLLDEELRYDWLPFVVSQFYPVHNCIYGGWVTHKLRASKAYINNITQDIIDGSRLSSTKLLGMGNSWEILDWDIYPTPWSINMVRFSNGVDQMRAIDTQVNVWGQIQARQMVNEMMRLDTWFDLNAPFEAPADTLWQTEIIEQNKAIRYKCIDEAKDFALEEALQATLYNIKMFAPSIFKRVIKIKDWENETDIVKNPVIQIKNVSVKKQWKRQVIEEDYGQYGYIELTDDMLKWDLKVRVTTQSTENPVLKIIEKNKAKEMIDSRGMLSQIYWPEIMEWELPAKEVIEKYKQVYWYAKTMTPMSKKRQIIQRNEEAVAWLKEFLDSTTMQNASNTQTPQQGQMPVGGEMQPSPATGGQSQLTTWAEQILSRWM